VSAVSKAYCISDTLIEFIHGTSPEGLVWVRKLCLPGVLYKTQQNTSINAEGRCQDQWPTLAGSLIKRTSLMDPHSNAISRIHQSVHSAFIT